MFDVRKKRNGGKKKKGKAENIQTAVAVDSKKADRLEPVGTENKVDIGYFNFTLSISIISLIVYLHVTVSIAVT